VCSAQYEHGHQLEIKDRTEDFIDDFRFKRFSSSFAGQHGNDGVQFGENQFVRVLRIPDDCIPSFPPRIFYVVVGPGGSGFVLKPAVCVIRGCRVRKEHLA
jgi:hypothetical protein